MQNLKIYLIFTDFRFNPYTQELVPALTKYIKKWYPKAEFQIIINMDKTGSSDINVEWDLVTYCTPLSEKGKFEDRLAEELIRIDVDIWIKYATP